MTESRLQRWSRQKIEARKETDHSSPVPEEAGPSPEEQELTLNETLPEQEILRKYQLPDPETIELGTDITGFMGQQIPEFLRRKALRALWRSNPVLAVLDGLNDYDEDFTTAATAADGVKTLYRVGQGFIDKSADSGVPNGEATGEPMESSDSVIPPQAAGQYSKPPDTESAGETNRPPDTDGLEQPASTVGHSEAAVADPERAPAQRYRPRMRFTT